MTLGFEVIQLQNAMGSPVFECQYSSSDLEMLISLGTSQGKMGFNVFAIIRVLAVRTDAIALSAPHRYW